ncbi:ATP-dependent DNA ligase LigD [Dehalogenimonas formicexedens]|uniref:DNA ligase (ATP) n=1 Tax=Dehalogenimonas formicexedens TaxID=1839801 RepID=A0A1P8F6C5_9CHLR|nr:non-homologous end-joining DNA ligase [Dehalogenimonas formicexedens]APV44031.1 ATP-dependent DNA ligase LigD [Dehalogenimonas formicexedens]
MPERLAPMLATLTEKPFTDPDWYFEPKLDGYRIVVFVRNGESRLQSRHFQDYTGHFPSIAKEMSQQPVKEAIFDGELVALDENGKPCFQCLQQHLIQQRENIVSGYLVLYYAFDLLYLDGFDLTALAQSERAGLLKTALRPGKSVKAISRFEGDGAEIFKAAIEAGFEGIIAKRRDAPYQEGKRSNDWLKIKGTLADEFIIAGYTSGQGARSGAFGSLVLAQYDDNKRLAHAGNVGTGFDERLLEDLKAKMDKLTTGKSPFDARIPFENKTTWLKPELVAEVKYAERTRDGILRHPVFLRLRDDKPATDVKAQKILRSEK